MSVLFLESRRKSAGQDRMSAPATTMISQAAPFGAAEVSGREAAKPTPRAVSSYDSQRTKVARRVKLAHNRPRPSNAARDASRIAAGIDDHVWGLETIVGLLDHAVADTHAASLKVCGHD